MDKQNFIDFMQSVGALTFGDFVTKSGRNTPYFVNTGKYNDGQSIAKLGEFYASCICANVEVNENTVLFGPAYKGIPLVVATAAALAQRGINIKFCFNRKEEKDHGEGGSLVGYPLQANSRVLIIEDVITAGTAVREVLPLLQNTGATVEALFISVDRMERGIGQRTAIQEIKEAFGISTYPIVNVKEIYASVQDEGLKTRMQAYMQEYCNL